MESTMQSVARSMHQTRDESSSPEYEPNSLQIPASQDLELKWSGAAGSHILQWKV